MGIRVEPPRSSYSAAPPPPPNNNDNNSGEDSDDSLTEEEWRLAGEKDRARAEERSRAYDDASQTADGALSGDQNMTEAASTGAGGVAPALEPLVGDQYGSNLKKGGAWPPSLSTLEKMHAAAVAEADLPPPSSPLLDSSLLSSGSLDSDGDSPPALNVEAETDAEMGDVAQQPPDRKSVV